MSYFWTVIPFLIFLAFILRHEIKHKKMDKSRNKETERYMRPVARTTSRMFEKQYGRPSIELENTFPDIKNAK